MKVTQHSNGNCTIQGVPWETVDALAHIAHDLGRGHAVLHHDKRWFDSWSRPKKKTRKAFRDFAADVGEWSEWSDYFTHTKEPKFGDRSPFGGRVDA